LTKEEIFEEINSEYADKTATFDPFPFTNERKVAIHPCKHAKVLKELGQRARDKGNNFGVK